MNEHGPQLADGSTYGVLVWAKLLPVLGFIMKDRGFRTQMRLGEQRGMLEEAPRP